MKGTDRGVSRKRLNTGTGMGKEDGSLPKRMPWKDQESRTAGELRASFKLCYEDCLREALCNVTLLCLSAAVVTG